jgi:hypothetical protein
MTKAVVLSLDLEQKTNSVAFNPEASYTDWETATGLQILLPALVDIGGSRC